MSNLYEGKFLTAMPYENIRRGEVTVGGRAKAPTTKLPSPAPAWKQKSSGINIRTKYRLFA